MKLKIEFIEEISGQMFVIETGKKIVIKNKETKVMYRNSDVHNAGDELTGKIMKLEANVSEIVNTFYKLANSF